MKWLVAVLLLLLLVLQYRLWIPEGSKAELSRLQAEIERQQAFNDGLRERNRELELEVMELQSGVESLEERARQDLGLIKQGETFYQVVEAEPEQAE